MLQWKKVWLLLRWGLHTHEFEKLGVHGDPIRRRSNGLPEQDVGIDLWSDILREVLVNSGSVIDIACVGFGLSEKRSFFGDDEVRGIVFNVGFLWSGRGNRETCPGEQAYCKYCEEGSIRFGHVVFLR